MKLAPARMARQEPVAPREINWVSPWPRSGASGRVPRVRTLVGVALIAGLAAWEIGARRSVAPGEPFVRIRRAVSIGVPDADPFSILTNPELISRLLDGTRVVAESPNRWHWTFQAPGGFEVQGQTSIVDVRPGRHISWRAVNGAAVQYSASFEIFPGMDGGDTIVHATVELFPSSVLPIGLTAPALRLAADQQVATLLYRIRALLETGEIPMVTGQSSGNPADHEEDADSPDGALPIGRVVYGESADAPAIDRQLPSDEMVEEASEDSFPASDPPAWTRTAPAPTEESSAT
jgi:uncharacterized membrane protein